MALGDRQRAAAIARANANRPPTVGRGVGVDDQAYRDVVWSEPVDLAKEEGVVSDLKEEADSDITPATRKLVYERSSAETGSRRCEARASRRCSGAGQHLHHRKLRRWGDHSAINLLDVCLFCHHDIHAQPRAAYLRGLMVRSTDDPASRAVVPGPLPC